MTAKQILLNKLFWLRLVCQRFDLKHHSEALQCLHYHFYAAHSSDAYQERVERLYNRMCIDLVRHGYDYEKEMQIIMGQNSYQSFKQMKPDFGF